MTSTPERIITRHLEDMHDALAVYLKQENVQGAYSRDFDGGESFAAHVAKCIRDGLMTLAEYADWYREEVAPK